MTQLLSALLDGVSNDSANMLADMLGGQRAAVAAMNRKAASVGARGTRARHHRPGLDRSRPAGVRHQPPHDLAAVIFRAALRYPLIAQIMRSQSAPFRARSLSNQNELLARYSGRVLGGKTGFHQPGPARCSPSGQLQRGNRRPLWCRCTEQVTCTASRSACWTGDSAIPEGELPTTAPNQVRSP